MEKNTKNIKKRDVCQNWFYLCLALCGVILALLAMFFNYNLKLDERTVKLEKKNGKEQHEIDELKKEIKELKKKLGGN